MSVSLVWLDNDRKGRPRAFRIEGHRAEPGSPPVVVMRDMAGRADLTGGLESLRTRALTPQEARVLALTLEGAADTAEDRLTPFLAVAETVAAAWDDDNSNADACDILTDLAAAWRAYRGKP